MPTSQDLVIICGRQQQHKDRPITLPLTHTCGTTMVTTAAACVPVRVELFRFFPVVGVTMYGHDGDDHLSSLGNGQIFGGKCLGASSSATDDKQHAFKHYPLIISAHLHCYRRVQSKCFLDNIVQISDLLTGFIKRSILQQRRFYYEKELRQWQHIHVLLLILCSYTCIRTYSLTYYIHTVTMAFNSAGVCLSSSQTWIPQGYWHTLSMGQMFLLFLLPQPKSGPK